MNTCRQPAAKTLRESTTSQRFNTGFARMLIVMIVLVLCASAAMATNPLPLINAPLAPGKSAGFGHIHFDRRGHRFCLGRDGELERQCPHHDVCEEHAAHSDH